MIQAREDAFFKELAAEPSQRKGHPLAHLVTAHAKITSVHSNRPGLGGAAMDTMQQVLGGGHFSNSCLQTPERDPLLLLLLLLVCVREPRATVTTSTFCARLAAAESL